MKQIYSAFVKAQKAFAPALKTSTNPHFRSKYIDLAGCVEAVMDALNANGIALVQQTSESDSGVIVETVFIHESGEMMQCGKLHVPASKNDAQGYGSALTYARRYSLMAACGIAPEDDDGNAASHGRTQAAPVRATYQAKLADVAASIKVISNAKDTDALNKLWSVESPKFDKESKEFQALRNAANERKSYLQDMALAAMQDVTA